MLTTIHAVTTYNVSKKFGNTLGLKMGQYQHKNPQHFGVNALAYYAIIIEDNNIFLLGFTFF